MREDAENGPSYGDAFKSDLSSFAVTIHEVGKLLDEEQRKSLVTPLIILIVEIGDEPLENNAEATAAFARINGTLLRALLGALRKMGYDDEAQSVERSRRRLSEKVRRIPSDPLTQSEFVKGRHSQKFSSVDGRSRRR